VARNAILLFFSSKFQLLSTNVCCKVSSSENFQRQSCSYIIPLSNGPWIDCGRRPHLPKICTQSDPTAVKKRRFWHISLVPQPRELAKKSVIANRKSTTRFPASHRQTVYITPTSRKGLLKTKIFTFGVSLHFFVAGNCRHLKLNMWVEHSKSQPMDDKMSLRWALPRHVTHFKLLVPLRYLWNGLSYRLQIWCTCWS